MNTQQTLLLQLQVSETATRHTTRDGIGLALASVINRIIPFDFFLHSIWMPGASSGYRISSVKTPEGQFALFNDQELERFREQHLQEFVEAGIFASDPVNARIYQGDVLKTLCARFSAFRVGYENHGIRSLMVFNMVHENGARHAMVISSRTENAFDEAQRVTIRIVLPQIKLAFENLFKYERLKEEEEKKEAQLELNNELLGHTNLEDFGIALAQVVNRVAPCDRFIIRTWTGPVTLGYRLPLVRVADGRFERFSDLLLVQHAEANPEHIIAGSQFLAANPGLYQGEAFKNLCAHYPMLALGAATFRVQSAMVMSFKKDDTTFLLIMANVNANAFREEQYQFVQMLMPQIRLAFENLFKYERLRQEELERKTQLDLMTAFSVQGDLEDMALNAISKMNDFIPFDFWMQISSTPTGQDLYFRLAQKQGQQFNGMAGAELFQRLGCDPIDIHTFMANHQFLFEHASLFVGDDFDRLIDRVEYFNLLHRQLKLNSLIVFPITVMGKPDTILMMGSTREFAFSQADMDSLRRIIPYISMAAQQYYSLHHIQRLTAQLEQEKNYLVEEIKANYNFEEIIGTSHAMKAVFRQISQVAPTDSTVLIQGETGTGKELIARAIHNQSPRKTKVLVKVNCASLPAQLIESELFGHERGSFTGAHERRIGKFELANEGTIFLDEIGELPLELQAKLLRVLQEREIERIGGKTTIGLNVRIIAATNRDLEAEVAAGKFRSDLFYRLSVFPIHLPPLRERKEDLPMLTAHFMQKFSRKMKRPLLGVKDETIRDVMHYDWPGNIRELENVIEQAVIIGDTNSIKLKKTPTRKSGNSHTGFTIDTDPASKRPETASTHIKHRADEEEILRMLTDSQGKIMGPSGVAARLGLRPAQLEHYERKWILTALQQCAGRIRGDNGAAMLLQMKATTLEARISKLKILKSEIFSHE